VDFCRGGSQKETAFPLFGFNMDSDLRRLISPRRELEIEQELPPLYERIAFTLD
jgi:hypothetical protein